MLGAVAVVLLIGLGGGAVLAATAGARRTASAASRLYQRGNVADVEIDPTQGSVVRPADLDRLRRLPEVAHVTTAQFFGGASLHGGKPGPLNAFVAANTDGTWISQFDRIGLLPSFPGRMPDPSRADEVVVTSAKATPPRQGRELVPVAFAKFASPDSSAPPVYPRPITLHIVGLATTPIGLLHGGESSETFLFATPAFARRFADHSVGSTVYVRLHHRQDLLAFERQAPVALRGTTFDFQAASQELTTFGRVARPFTATLWIFALVAALSTLLIVAQALVRMVRTDAAEAPELGALAQRVRSGRQWPRRRGDRRARGRGPRRARERAGIAAVPARPRSPRRTRPGPARRLRGTPAGRPGHRGVVRGDHRRSSTACDSRGQRHERAGSAAAITDCHNAGPRQRAGQPGARARLTFQRTRSNTTASTASSLFGLVAAAAAISAALVFGANLRQLTTPSRYGQTWDAEITSNGVAPLSPTAVQHTLTSASLASDVTFGTFGDAHLARRIVPAYGLQPSVGHTLPVALKGRLAQSSDEVALGAKTLRQLGRSVGDTITTTASNGRTEQLHIVGETLLPSLNTNSPTLGADEGAEMTRGGLARLNPDLTRKSTSRWFASRRERPCRSCVPGSGAPITASLARRHPATSRATATCSRRRSCSRRCSPSSASACSRTC